MKLGDIKNGMRVKVISDRLYHNQSLIGCIGTVMNDFYTGNIAVKLDTVENARSRIGCFYFDNREIEPVEINANNEKENVNMHKVTNYLNSATIQYADTSTTNRSVEYANFDPALVEGDLCVIRDGDHFRIAKVIHIHKSTGEPLSYEIVSRVDTTDYDNRVTARKAAAELKAKMEARAKKLQDIALYQMLAKDDPEMAELLKNYQDIIQ